MESLAQSEHAAGPNGDDHDRQTTEAAPPSLVSGRTAISPLPPAEADPAVEQLKQLLIREAARLRQNTSGFMTVAVCVDEGTELLLHFSQRDGGIEASARCERGDEQRLNALWPALKQSLVSRKIHLAPLRRCATGRSSAASLSPASLHPERRGCRNDAPVSRPDWETWA